MPGEGEVALGIECLDIGLPFEVFVTGIGDTATPDLACLERPVELHTEPLAEFAIIGERLPDAGDGGVNLNSLFDAVGFHRRSDAGTGSSASRRSHRHRRDCNPEHPGGAWRRTRLPLCSDLPL